MRPDAWIAEPTSSGRFASFFCRALRLAISCMVRRPRQYDKGHRLLETGWRSFADRDMADSRDEIRCSLVLSIQPKNASVDDIAGGPDPDRDRGTVLSGGGVRRSAQGTLERDLKCREEAMASWICRPSRRLPDRRFLSRGGNHRVALIGRATDIQSGRPQQSAQCFFERIHALHRRRSLAGRQCVIDKHLDARHRREGHQGVFERLRRYVELR